jgi:shikimate kinase
MRVEYASPGHIYLVGFMGSGKSIVGRILAAKLARPFVDMDSLIEARSGKTISQIFTEGTEAEFRRLESLAIESCKNLAAAVVALGGGAFLSHKNRSIVQESGVSVWLDCPLQQCLARIRDDDSRPLLGDDSEMETLLSQRTPFYAQASVVVQTGDRTPEQIAAEVISQLGAA